MRGVNIVGNLGWYVEGHRECDAKTQRLSMYQEVPQMSESTDLEPTNIGPRAFKDMLALIGAAEGKATKV